MRWSRLFIPTLREDPADAEAVSHRLMLRAGLIRQLGAGIYSMLPLGYRVMRKVEAIVREEMERIGAQEFLLPALHPAEIWRESGRWEEMGEAMFRLRDRKQAELCLGMTHEEVFTAVARDELRSYRQLPQIWYQIQTKFRDEARPKSGVLRGRQFTMKDSYSFDLDFEGLDRSFELHADAYRRIFERCGIEVIAVEASSGAMGGSESVEFMAISEAGEDWVVTCSGCGYAANLEKAVSRPTPVEEPEDPAAPERFPTPGVRTIDELATFPDGAPAERQIKTLVYIARGEPVLLLLRGDHELNEVKAIEAVGSSELRAARDEEILDALGAHAGSLGAVGVTHLPIYLDRALEGRRGMTTGANQDDFHLRHVDVARDIGGAQIVDLRTVVEGEACLRCGKALDVRKSIEVGHIFKLGLRYSESMGARVLDAQGREVPLVMGSYGIGIERIMAAAIESHHDENGICWPWPIAPYHVVITPIRVRDAEQGEVAAALGAELAQLGFDVLVDDRDERPGVRFKDADLVGFPWRVVLGPRAMAEGKVELFERVTGQIVEVPRDELVAELRRRMR
ncbi:MAG: proline--tRNA ligase [Myxococcota bacterium]